MQHRDGMRPRTIDDNKEYQIIKDIENIKKTLSPEEKKELEKFESDLNKVIQHFDNRKKIIIPKSLMFDNNKLNHNLNEKRNKKKQNINKINSDLPVYELKEYKRPAHYIIYSSKERDQLKAKDYEAKYPDQIFLNFHGDFMKLEVLEAIISTLENNIGKGDKIPDEMAKKIIEDKFSKYKSKSDLIIKHFNIRRSELKKSLLRKYWRLQKSTDKYFTNTFKRRERDKMKIRKNIHKKEESFEKVKMAGDLCKTNILSIIDSMNQKEAFNKILALIDNMMFISEVNKIQNNSMSKECIRQNNEISSFLQEKGISLNEEKNITEEEKEEKEKIEEYRDDKSEDRGRVSTASTRADNNKRDSEKKEEELIISDNKSTIPEIIYPPIYIESFDSSKEKNIKIKRENNKYRARIRINRIKKLSVDRYIQKKDSMDPFDDSFNENIMEYQKIEPNLEMNSTNTNYFENLIKKYYEEKCKYLSYFSNNDEEFEEPVKNKINKRLINKKRTNNK